MMRATWRAGGGGGMAARGGGSGAGAPPRRVLARHGRVVAGRAFTPAPPPPKRSCRPATGRSASTALHARSDVLRSALGDRAKTRAAADRYQECGVEQRRNHARSPPAAGAGDRRRSRASSAYASSAAWAESRSAASDSSRARLRAARNAAPRRRLAAALHGRPRGAAHDPDTPFLATLQLREQGDEPLAPPPHLRDRRGPGW